MGTTITEGWLIEIFGGKLTYPKATLLTLISSTGRLTNLTAFPACLADLATLPDTAEIYHSSVYLPPSYVGMAAPNSWLTAPVPLIPTSAGDSVGPLHVSTVYLALHTSIGFTPLHSAVNYDTFWISLCLCTLRTISHEQRRFFTKRWRNHCHDHPTRPSSRVSFGLSKIMTPRTTILLCVFTSLTRRYSGLSGPLRRHTPTKSRNGCTS